MACFLPRSPVKELSKQIAPRLTEFDIRLERLEAKNESASKELASASEACQHQQRALHDMLLAWPTSTLVRQALCHHAENLQQRNRSEDALPLLEKAMKEAAKAGGASGAEAVAAQAQYALALFEVERATEANVHHAQAAQGYA